MKVDKHEDLYEVADDRRDAVDGVEGRGEQFVRHLQTDLVGVELWDLAVRVVTGGGWWWGSGLAPGLQRGLAEL